MADKKLECKRMPAETFIKRAKESFDIIYLDPPFPYKFHIELLEKIEESKILKEGGLVMMHRPSEKAMPQTIGSLTKSDERVYGRSIVDFYRKKIPGENDV